MLLYEVLDGTRTYDTFEGASKDLADAVIEVKALEKDRDDYKDKAEQLEEENLRLRERNLELLSMITIDEKEKEKEETEEIEKLTIEDVYKEV